MVPDPVLPLDFLKTPLTVSLNDLSCCNLVVAILKGLSSFIHSLNIYLAPSITEVIYYFLHSTSPNCFLSSLIKALKLFFSYSTTIFTLSTRIFRIFHQLLCAYSLSFLFIFLNSFKNCHKI